MSQPGIPPVPPPPPGSAPPPPADPGDGAPTDGGEPRRRNRRGWIIGAVAAAVVVAVPSAAIAWQALDGGGTQPHDVLPSDAIAYVRLDLDPSASQKIEAFRFLRQFPAMSDLTDLDDDVDLRKVLVEEFADASGCSIDFENDVKPWAGDRIGAAMLPPAGDQSEPGFVIAVQTDDENAAEDTLRKVVECDASGTPIGTIYLDGYLLITDTSENAERYADQAQESALADNEDFAEAMNRLGDPGVISAWMSVTGLMDAIPDVFAMDPTGMYPADPEIEELTRKMIEGSYRSVATTFRFDNDYVEIAAVTAGDLYQDGAAGLDVDVPEDTTMIFGMAGGSDVLQDTWDMMAEMFPEMSDMIDELNGMSGLTMPDDIKTLLGDNAVLALDASSLDLEALFEYGDFPSLDVGLKVTTDPSAFEEVWEQLDTLAADAGFPLDMLTQQATDDGYVVTLNPDYADTLIEGGDLASSKTYTTAIKNAAEADSVFYFNFDSIEDNILSMAEGELPDEAVESIRKLSAIGLTTQLFDGYSEMTFRLTTN